MNSLIKQIAATALFAGLSMNASSAMAQQARVGATTQQGNGAFVAKENTVFTLTSAQVASLTGVAGLPEGGSTSFTTLRYNITPSGNSKSVIQGTLPEGSRPTQSTTFNSTYTEAEAGPTFGKVYDTVAVIEPSGVTTISATLKSNDKGKGKSKGKK